MGYSAVLPVLYEGEIHELVDQKRFFTTERTTYRKKLFIVLELQKPGGNAFSLVPKVS